MQIALCPSAHYELHMTKTGTIKILLADDHMVVRKGLVHVLESAPDFDVIAEAESGEEALYLCKKHKPDIVIMDVQMEGLGGIETTRLLVEHQSAVRVVGLSTFADPTVVKDMMAAGALGYLLKDISAKELTEAIRRVHSGETVLSPGLKKSVDDSLVAPHPSDDTEDHVNMGEHQRRVLALLTKGFTNPEIATYLGISQPTARYHVSAILKKFGASNRAEAVAFAIRNNLISESDF